MKRFLAGAGVVSVLGVGFCGVVYQRRLKENKSITAVAYNAKQDQKRLEESLSSLSSKTPAKVFFYRYTTCPFCSKVKAMLDLHGIPHDCIEVEPMFKGEIKQSEYKKVPQLQFQNTRDGPYLVDSDIIVDRLAEVTGKKAQVENPDVNKWRAFARESLVRHLVVNINKTLVSAWGGYEYIDRFDTIPYTNKLFLKVMGAPVMYLVSRLKTVPALKKSGELRDSDDVRTVLHTQVNKFADEALAGPVSKAGGAPGPAKKFHGGEAPDLADVDVYGVLQSIRGHKIYDDILASTRITPWLERMDAATGKHKYQSGVYH